MFKTVVAVNHSQQTQKCCYNHCDNIVFMVDKYCGQMLSQHFFKFLEHHHNVVAKYLEIVNLKKTFKNQNKCAIAE